METKDDKARALALSALGKINPIYDKLKKIDDLDERLTYLLRLLDEQIEWQKALEEAGLNKDNLAESAKLRAEQLRVLYLQKKIKDAKLKAGVLTDGVYETSENNIDVLSRILPTFEDALQLSDAAYLFELHVPMNYTTTLYMSGEFLQVINSEEKMDIYVQGYQGSIPNKTGNIFINREYIHLITIGGFSAIVYCMTDEPYTVKSIPFPSVNSLYTTVTSAERAWISFSDKSLDLYTGMVELKQLTLYMNAIDGDLLKRENLETLGKLQAADSVSGLMALSQIANINLKAAQVFEVTYEWPEKTINIDVPEFDISLTVDERRALYWLWCYRAYPLYIRQISDGTHVSTLAWKFGEDYHEPFLLLQNTADKHLSFTLTGVTVNFDSSATTVTFKRMWTDSNGEKIEKEAELKVSLVGTSVISTPTIVRNSDKTEEPYEEPYFKYVDNVMYAMGKDMSDIHPFYTTKTSADRFRFMVDKDFTMGPTLYTKVSMILRYSIRFDLDVPDILGGGEIQIPGAAVTVGSSTKQLGTISLKPEITINSGTTGYSWVSNEYQDTISYVTEIDLNVDAIGQGGQSIPVIQPKNAVTRASGGCVLSATKGNFPENMPPDNLILTKTEGYIKVLPAYYGPSQQNMKMSIPSYTLGGILNGWSRESAIFDGTSGFSLMDKDGGYTNYPAQDFITKFTVKITDSKIPIPMCQEGYRGVSTNSVTAVIPPIALEDSSVGNNYLYDMQVKVAKTMSDYDSIWSKHPSKIRVESIDMVPFPKTSANMRTYWANFNMKDKSAMIINWEPLMEATVHDLLVSEKHMTIVDPVMRATIAGSTVKVSELIVPAGISPLSNIVSQTTNDRGIRGRIRDFQLDVAKEFQTVEQQLVYINAHIDKIQELITRKPEMNMALFAINIIKTAISLVYPPSALVVEALSEVAETVITANDSDFEAAAVVMSVGIILARHGSNKYTKGWFKSIMPSRSKVIKLYNKVWSKISGTRGMSGGKNSANLRDISTFNVADDGAKVISMRVIRGNKDIQKQLDDMLHIPNVPNPRTGTIREEITFTENGDVIKRTGIKSSLIVTDSDKVHIVDVPPSYWDVVGLKSEAARTSSAIARASARPGSVTVADTMPMSDDGMFFLLLNGSSGKGTPRATSEIPIWPLNERWNNDVEKWLIESGGI